ncbi:PEPxxWA-CTERM sorting domain-containing protein [Sandarakinorhabdus sp.]|uniref:PEPxxWA-CTERM sorting domain-containing protein n=1 Tax=Sandarakinorhabdus sp. TaxID=1916663 RepID=UPI00286E8E8B|nr:PEPxxWA-CTERM sorting domain-containing protein [Sandarakinorhabdus sp.]
MQAYVAPTFALTLAMAVTGTPVLAGVTISNGTYSVGIGQNGELWDPSTGIGFVRLSDGFDPMAPGTPRDSWGVSLGTDGGPWADQTYFGSIVTTTLSQTSAASATAYTNVGYLSFAVEQHYSFVAPNILKISEVIHNGQYRSFFWFQRNWDVDVTPTEFAENSFAAGRTAPGILDATYYGFEHPDASIPYTRSCLSFCNVTGNVGGGIKVDFFGRIIPAFGTARVDYYYGISQPGQSSSDLIRQALGVGAQFLMVTQSAENGAWPYSGRNSAFIGVDTNVPEPASWAMMIAGFGLVGAAKRRRRMTVKEFKG